MCKLAGICTTNSDHTQQGLYTPCRGTKLLLWLLVHASRPRLCRRRCDTATAKHSGCWWCACCIHAHACTTTHHTGAMPPKKGHKEESINARRFHFLLSKAPRRSPNCGAAEHTTTHWCCLQEPPTTPEGPPHKSLGCPLAVPSMQPRSQTPHPTTHFSVMSDRQTDRQPFTPQPTTPRAHLGPGQLATS